MNGLLTNYEQKNFYFFQKPIDKLLRLWYNIIRKREEQNPKEKKEEKKNDKDYRSREW